MRQILRIGLLFWAIFLFMTGLSLSGQYRIIQLSSGGSENWYPSINNNGEVVWQGWDGKHTNIYSNFRGQITSNLGSTFPAINNNGEIVWMTMESISGNLGYSIYSNKRGRIQAHTQTEWYYFPSINDKGEIVCDKIYSNNNYGELISNTRGIIDSNTSGDYYYFVSSINSDGEIVYQKKYSGLFQIFSSVMGQITQNAYNNYSWYGKSKVNNSGEIVWYADIGSQDYRVFSSTRGQLTNKYSLYPSINNNGEIVWMEYDEVRHNYHIYSSKHGLVTPLDMDARNPVINDLGQIAFVSGQHTYLALPVFSPAPFMLLLLD